MSDAMNRVKDYQPSKAVWFWSCAGACVLTMIVGFTWGGWVTGGTAQERVEAASEHAVAELAASICVQRFLAAPDAGEKLAQLKEESRWSRDDLVQDAGWTTFASAEEPVDGAAELCAEQLAEAELPATTAAVPAAVPAEATVPTTTNSDG